MPRLFIGERELNLAADLARELITDVIGQEVTLYPISEIKSDVHEVYDESIRKVFENPIRLSVLIDWGEQEIRTGKQAHETVRTLEAHFLSRDLLSRGVELFAGDFLQYGSQFFEITGVRDKNLAFGQIEEPLTVTVSATEAREGQFRTALQGRLPRNIDAERLPFFQQRSFEENIEGETGSVRDLVKNKTLEAPLSGPKEVSDKPADEKGHSFYSDD